MNLEKIDLNRCVELVGGWLNTEPPLLSWVVAGAIALLLLTSICTLTRIFFRLFGGQFNGPSLAYCLLVSGGAALGAGIASYSHKEAWIGALIGVGVGAILSGLCCVIGSIAKYCE